MNQPLFCFFQSSDAIGLKRKITNFIAQPHLDKFDTVLDETQAYRIAWAIDHFDGDWSDITQKLKAYLNHPFELGQVSDKSKRCAFIMTGQGSQYVGMAKALFDSQLAFKNALISCDAWFVSELGQSLIELLYDQGADHQAKAQVTLDQTGFTQPALFAIEYALAQLWRAYGVDARWVIGHSVGEYAAAVHAGVMTVEEGLALITQRARLMQQLPEGGGMMAVMASQSTLQPIIDAHQHHGCLGIAAFNGPKQIVLSGDVHVLSEVKKTLTMEGIKSKFLAVSHAFHSNLMAPMLEPFAEQANKILACPSTTDRFKQVALISNVTGQVQTDLPDPAYWVNHVVAPVKFYQAIMTLHGQGVETVIEIGPQPILIGMSKRCLEDPDHITWLPSVTKRDPLTFYSSLATYCQTLKSPVDDIIDH